MVRSFTRQCRTSFASFAVKVFDWSSFSALSACELTSIFFQLRASVQKTSRTVFLTSVALSAPPELGAWNERTISDIDVLR